MCSSLFCSSISLAFSRVGFFEAFEADDDHVKVINLRCLFRLFFVFFFLDGQSRSGVSVNWMRLRYRVFYEVVRVKESLCVGVD